MAMRDTLARPAHRDLSGTQASSRATRTRARRYRWCWAGRHAVALPSRPDRLVVIGVLNVAPDSSPTAAAFIDLDDAVAHWLPAGGRGSRIWSTSAAKSTSPGRRAGCSRRRRTPGSPVVEALVANGIRVSIDTRIGGGRRARAGSATRVGGQRRVGRARRPCAGHGGGGARAAELSMDPRCTGVGTAAGCRTWPTMPDVLDEVRRELAERASRRQAGISADRIVIDPEVSGSPRQRRTTRRCSRPSRRVGRPRPCRCWIGASRKAVPPGACSLIHAGTPRPIDEREAATVALTAYAAAQGAWEFGCTTCERTSMRPARLRQSVQAATDD